MGKVANANRTECLIGCALGKHIPIETSTECVDCPAGRFGAADATYGGVPKCIPCSTGHYQNLPGQTTCKACAAGTTATETGSSQCVECGVGKQLTQGGITRGVYEEDMLTNPDFRAAKLFAGQIPICQRKSHV